MSAQIYPFDLPPLRYPDDALEPHVTASRLHWHHEVEHRSHVDALNAALHDAPTLHERSIEDIMRHLGSISEPLRGLLRVHGGAHANHQFFWKILAMNEGSAPSGSLAAALTATFGGLAGFQQAFQARAMALNGPGWVFLVTRGLSDPALEIVVLPENDTVLERGEAGVLCCDLWEHAHEAGPIATARARWVESFWKILAWDVASRRYDAILAGASQL